MCTGISDHKDDTVFRHLVQGDLNAWGKSKYSRFTFQVYISGFYSRNFFLEDDTEIKVTAIGVEISADEKEFLKLPKSATDFVGINEEKIETSIQIMAAKLRMALKNQEEEGEEGLEVEEQEALLASRRVFDPEAKIEDRRKLRVTDLPTCKRITVPEASEFAKEAKIQVLIDGLEEAMRKNGRKEKTCPKAGKSSLSTLTDQQRRGKESLLRREKAGELIMVGSDKSGKNIPMSVELYKSCMEPQR